MQDSKIHIKGAKVHNLKNLELKIPRGKLIVITGLSGSGKSSLAFDTIYAEGYRKYMDSLSTRARALLDQMPRPEVDFIHGLSPVIAIEQRTGTHSNPRATVATTTEIADYARLLWALCGKAYCPIDKAPIERRSLDDCIQRIFEETEGSRLILLAPYQLEKAAVIRDEIPHIRQRGFQKLRINGEIKDIDDINLIPKSKNPIQVDIVIDRIVLRADQRGRIADSLELAFREGNDKALILSQENRDTEFKEFSVSQHLSCTCCGTVYQAITPKSFSYNNPQGACSCCGGMGKSMTFTPELLVPDPTKSVKNGAIKAWRLGSKAMIIKRNALLKQLAEQLPFDPKLPWQELDKEIQNIILFGAGDRKFSFKLKPGNTKPEEMIYEGVLADLERAKVETSSDGFRAKLMAFQSSGDCPECHGKRLKAEACNVKILNTSFVDFMEMDIRVAYDFIKELPDKYEAINQASDAHKGLENRLRFLLEVGLDYLQLERAYSSLSGGEAQRARLATQLGMGLVGVVYVLDEPTIGLHPHDSKKLFETLLNMRDRGNTVIVVEHDGEFMKKADELIELGPGAGESGGHILFQGSVDDCMKSRKSRTGPYLSGKIHIDKDVPTITQTERGFLQIHEASEHNLQNVTAKFPIGFLSVVTGVSGSGKSTLINDILANYAAFRLNRAKSIAGKHKKITGLENFSSVVRVDQSPIGQSPRSNPATYVKLFDLLRQLFAQCPLAKVRAYTAGRFSFNTTGGRCERCKGDGMIKLDMQFLADVYSECPSCQAKRYNRETLEIKFKGFNIAEVLDLSVDEALMLFKNQPKIYAKLETLQAVGLGYLKLGQASNTLSGGEAQRIKLSLELSKRNTGDTLYILDEPTTGLHWIDIQHLADLLFKLREQGNTIIVIEHNTDFIQLADWIVDLGPGGGVNGGKLIYEGPLEGIKDSSESLTAKALF